MTNPEEIRYRILKALDENPHLSQRDLARELGVSLGKANYCLRAMVTRGWVRVRTLGAGEKRRGYAYCLTQKGVEEKARVTACFLERRLEEFHAIRSEIEQLRREAAQDRIRGAMHGA